MIRLPLLVALLLAGQCPANEFLVADVATFDDAMKAAVAGDTIVLQNGEWKDVDLRVRGQGTAEKPITVRAAEPGTVKLTGNSRIRIAGEYLVVEGLWFHNCFPDKSDIVSFRVDSKARAGHSVLRNCAITQNTVSNGSAERKWVSLYGVENLVERCHFEGKTSKGTLLVVWLPEEAGGPTAKHRVIANYFGPRPRLGKNGGEIIRIGDSDTSMHQAECLVEGNTFEKCDGEVECISNKSCGNIYRANTFIECQGTLTLRHGNACLVEGNVFLGNHRKETGGIRVIGEDHRVEGNFLSGIEGDEARSALCLMNALQSPPLNSYWQVKRARIKDNTVLDCRQAITIGYADKDVTAPLPPVDCSFTGNYVSSEGRIPVALLDPNAKIAWKDNAFWGTATGVGEVSGISLNEVRMKRAMPPIPARKDTGVAWLPVSSSQ